ncbi:ABC transporter permease [Congregibacter litoralis]|uniref:ABC-type antimicrobial peptide transport system, permease component n=1 Tax=Congregibacter litoralis KT71 TaxID=314285 RepID=A4ABP2_9GAMM|nr:ABC transporter permease [Congregibacter litoralis]EAQ96555.1 ABC-type antimicrobial peptide transport system, permease component [Congregibacter litoralis KT71]
MFLNYLKIALRTIGANPLFSVINILGLAIGLACCIIITVFVNYELSYDKHWDNADRIYRVTRDFFGNDLKLARVAPPIGPLLQEDFAEIEDMTRIFQPGPLNIIHGSETTVEEGIVIADPNVFEFFNLEFVAGSRDSALATPNNMVLSERAAQRYFGSEDPLGQSLNLMGQVEATVTGVFRDLPENTHMAFEMVASIDAVPGFMGADELTNWGSNNYFTYIRLPAGYEPQRLSARFDDFLIKHRGADAPSGTALGLQRLTDIHLTSNRDSEWRANGSLSTVYTFSAVAMVVLLIACVNFMNLTTARSTQRAREVGIRKVVGATRGQIIRQFLGESVLLTAFSMLLAVALVELVLPPFSAFLEKPLVFSPADPQTLLTLVVGTGLVGLVAGSYPALYLSHFRPVEVLKGAAAGSGSAMLRKSLVVFQFTTSIALLIATGVVMAQMHYTKNLDLGFDRSRNVVMSLPYFVDLYEIYRPLRTEMETHPGIESVVYSSRVPSMQNLDGSGYVAQGKQMVSDNILAIADLKVDAHWFEHYGVSFLAGRTFRSNELRPEEPSDESPVTQAWVVLNESAARRFGWSPKEAVGKVIVQPVSRELDRLVNREVIGVIPDLYFSSLHDERKATIYSEPHTRYGRRLSVKLAPGNPQAAIAHMEAVWKRVLPRDPINWEFLDDRFDARYRADDKQAKLFGLFSAFAIFVATLGLFGLASFTTERRTKEIGIRKVMGASVADIVILLTTDFTRLVVIASVIAWPLAFYAMSQWLTRFAYAAPASEWAWLFIAAAVGALLIAWLTIAYQAARAALTRPVSALRYE